MTGGDNGALAAAGGQLPIDQGDGQDTIRGVVLNVIYRGDADGYVVLAVEVDGMRGAQRLTGLCGGIGPNERFVATGSWVEHARYGRQFRSVALSTDMPTSAEGLRSYLSSGALKGLGPKYANAVVEAFGDNTIAVLDRQPERLREVSGIGRKRAETILESWREKREEHETKMFLFQHGMGPARAATIFKRYGHATAALVRENPYRLIREIRGIGFRVADGIARSVGIPANAPMRLRAGVAFSLEEAIRRRGHSGLPREELAGEASRILECEIAEAEAAIEAAIQEGGALVLGQIRGADVVFPRFLYEAERAIAAHLERPQARQPALASAERRGRARAGGARDVHQSRRGAA